MSDEALYHLLFNAITDALSAMEQWNYGTAKTILLSAQQRAENGYLEREEAQDDEIGDSEGARH